MPAEQKPLFHSYFNWPGKLGFIVSGTQLVGVPRGCVDDLLVIEGKDGIVYQVRPSAISAVIVPPQPGQAPSGTV